VVSWKGRVEIEAYLIFANRNSEQDWFYWCNDVACDRMHGHACNVPSSVYIKWPGCNCHWYSSDWWSQLLQFYSPTPLTSMVCRDGQPGIL